jgi:hypothetical protein
VIVTVVQAALKTTCVRRYRVGAALQQRVDVMVRCIRELV